MPAELRRKILCEFLPRKDVVVQPSKDKGNLRSRTCDLLILNKQLCSELSEVLYEERTFAIHVHEGVFSGGVEFLNSGLQRLQYKDSFSTSTFQRFEEDEKLFGFQRLKRIELIIHQSQDELSKTTRHNPMLTYFTISTMLKLLKKDGNSELNYLKVSFAGRDTAGPEPSAAGPGGRRHAIMRQTQHWWNPDTKEPRETSVHGVSNIELVLHALLNIDKVHKLEVALPNSMKNHDKINAFVQRIATQLSSGNTAMKTFDYNLEHKLEVAREALDDWIFQLKFGKGCARDPDIWIDLAELQEEGYFESDDYEFSHSDERDKPKRAQRFSARIACKKSKTEASEAAKIKTASEKAFEAYKTKTTSKKASTNSAEAAPQAQAEHPVSASSSSSPQTSEGPSYGGAPSIVPSGGQLIVPAQPRQFISTTWGENGGTPLEYHPQGHGYRMTVRRRRPRLPDGYSGFYIEDSDDN